MQKRFVFHEKSVQKVLHFRTIILILLQKVYVFHDSWLQIGIIFGQSDRYLQKGYVFNEKSVQKVYR